MKAGRWERERGGDMEVGSSTYLGKVGTVRTLEELMER